MYSFFGKYYLMFLKVFCFLGRPISIYIVLYIPSFEGIYKQMKLFAQKYMVFNSRTQILRELGYLIGFKHIMLASAGHNNFREKEPIIILNP